MKKLALMLLCIAAFILIIGSVGALDNGNIGFGQCFVQSAIGLAVEWFALKNINKEG